MQVDNTDLLIWAELSVASGKELIEQAQGNTGLGLLKYVL